MTKDPNNYWEQLERLEKLIRASELKAGVVFSFHSLVLGLFIDRLDFFKPIFLESNFLVVLAVIWIIAVLISIYFCFVCFMPHMELKYDKNVFFFKDAAHSFGTIDEYTQKLTEVCESEKELYTQLGHQIHIESIIIDKKFVSVKKSITFFALSFAIALLIVLVWLIQLGF
ncbi:DUF5706 domain-containing protein [Arenibacter sp. GZD96]|uniref:Pycsar system effector family protein n=1 Tax=Aurantibrevibacter litoralis TaxID=3106030 RepID=UPI002AFE1B90|nr:Pycsar system effector family protein [Arenibacter sp. GZD-96]MEA1786042.1 DUF5706 domain-containing protein [Arenibacter sp. GZD-96]